MTARSGDLAAAAAARRAALEDKMVAKRTAGDPWSYVARSAVVMGAGTTHRQAAFPTQYRAKTVERDGKPFYEVSGYATAYDQKYDMWDMFGPYEESVAPGAATETLAANPDVVFLVNHTGLAMARTTNGGLTLSEDDHGLADKAYLNPDRQDVRDLVSAIEDGIVTEQSFAFRIDEGWWNDDFTEFKIMQFDINRGDVSAVNYGANPTTDIAARQQTILRELAAAPAGIQRAAQVILAENPAENILERLIEAQFQRTAPKKGGSTSMWGAIVDTWGGDIA